MDQKKLRDFNERGWSSLLPVKAPRGGDFLAHYHIGQWAEQLVLDCLKKNSLHRAIPYGTSHSEPFSRMDEFQRHMEHQYMLQAWSTGGQWKRPDLLLIPREFLRAEKGNDAWTPDLQHFDNDDCRPYVEKAKAAIEVENSLWQVEVARKAKKNLSFTVKKEDLEALRNWVSANQIPLFVVQVFYDCAYVLPFTTLEEVIRLPSTDRRHVAAEVDRTTHKETYMIPLAEGALLGGIPEPDVEGKVFKAPNGKVTVYGRLTGSAIEAANVGVLDRLAQGTLSTERNEAIATAETSVPESDEEEVEPRGTDSK